MPLRVDELGCDVLSSTGRKYLRGPRGTGFLYVRKALIPQLEPPLLDLHAAEWTTRDTYKIREDARRFENWETYYAGKIGLGVAVAYALDIGLSAIQERVFALAAELRKKLSQIPRVKVRDLGELQCGIVTFTVENRNLHEINRTLRTKNINVIVTSRHYTRLDMESRGIEDLLRASLHYYNSEEEIDIFCRILRSIM
jgi:selenocysteine lyase/cysteine desulfurase